MVQGAPHLSLKTLLCLFEWAELGQVLENRCHGSVQGAARPRSRLCFLFLGAGEEMCRDMPNNDYPLRVPGRRNKTDRGERGLREGA